MAENRPTAEEIDVAATSALIAAQAKSLRATLMRDRPGNPPASVHELAIVADLIEMLANDVVDLARVVTALAAAARGSAAPC